MTYEQNLINRISFYLASGGLFNPELADHIAVRTLLFECREALAQPDHGWTPKRIAGMARLKEAQDKKLTQPEQEPAGHGGRPMTLRECMEAEEPEQKPEMVGRITDNIKDMVLRQEVMLYTDKYLPIGTPVYATPPQRKPLTDEEIADLWSAQIFHVTDLKLATDFVRGIERAHGIGGEA